MATKRKTQSDITLSAGAAPAREHRKITRAKAPAVPAIETPVPVLPATPEVAAQAPRPSFEEIELLAYSYWEARGYQSGSPEEDWLRAERELSVRRTSAPEEA